MSDAVRALASMRAMDELAHRDTVLHRIHPAAHLLVTLAFTVCATSYGRYELSGLLPLAVYPLFVFGFGDIPLGAVLRRMVFALPFVLAVGILNPLFDGNTIEVWAGVRISAGWVSLLSIILRCCLTVTSALLLICVEGMAGIAAALRALRVPPILTAQLLITYRYIYVLSEEVARISLAHQLRAPTRRGVAIAQWGSLAGQWLLRTLKRAERTHEAMLCRGYSGIMPLAKERGFRVVDLGYVLGWTGAFAAARFLNIPELVGALVMAGGRL